MINYQNYITQIFIKTRIFPINSQCWEYPQEFANHQAQTRSGTVDGGSEHQKTKTGRWTEYSLLVRNKT